MNSLLLLSVIIGVSVQQITKKAYNQKVSGGAFSYSAASSFFALLVFIITSGGKFEYSFDLFWYSLGFAFTFCAASIGSMLAIAIGSLSLTSLATQYSLIIPTFYGLVALKEEATVLLYIGIALLLISLIFINFEKKGEPKMITLKWVFFTLIAFMGNGACSTIQKVQQLEFNGLYKSEFMIVALIIVVTVLLIFAMFTEKSKITYNLKKGSVLFAICGLANGIVNYLMLLLSKMPASVVFPVISAGGIITTALVSIFIYKEKLSAYQKIGLILGIISIIALNL